MPSLVRYLSDERRAQSESFRSSLGNTVFSLTLRVPGPRKPQTLLEPNFLFTLNMGGRNRTAGGSWQPPLCPSPENDQSGMTAQCTVLLCRMRTSDFSSTPPSLHSRDNVSDGVGLASQTVEAGSLALPYLPSKELNHPSGASCRCPPAETTRNTPVVNQVGSLIVRGRTDAQGLWSLSVSGC